MKAFLEQYAHLFVGMAIFSAVALVFSLLALPYFIGAIPDDYFEREERPKKRHMNLSLLSIAGLALKNIIGFVMVLAGIAMLVLPGQGLLTLLAGLLLMNFPGKYKLERKLVSIPAVLMSVNWFRRRQGKNEFIL